MKPEPPLDMFPNRPDVWYAGVDACQRGLPITFDHPYCCTLKDVWEAGWRAAAGDGAADDSAQALSLDEYGHWAKIGEAHFLRGAAPDGSLTTIESWPAYLSGYHEAERRARASKDAMPTLQHLIDAWSKARNALREHVWKMLPYDCAVTVDNERYKGPGIVRGYPSDDLSKVEVTIPNGNTWHYPVTSVRRVE